MVNREVIWIWQSKKHCIAILSARIIISHPPGPVTRWFLKNSHEGLGGQKGSLPRLLMSARSPDNQNDDWWYTVSLIQPWPWSITELYSDKNNLLFVEESLWEREFNVILSSKCSSFCLKLNAKKGNWPKTSPFYTGASLLHWTSRKEKPFCVLNWM